MNILTNTLGNPFTLLIAILFSFIDKLLNIISSIFIFTSVGIVKSLIIPSKYSLITRDASISMSLPLQ